MHSGAMNTRCWRINSLISPWDPGCNWDKHPGCCLPPWGTDAGDLQTRWELLAGLLSGRQQRWILGVVKWTQSGAKQAAVWELGNDTNIHEAQCGSPREALGWRQIRM